ncbi:hypothetical protein PV336_16520 [Streptomyces sp. MI02-2A]|uniref:hypothetical protein n=1 Tax=Streptomyces sp. MI02-2A TaxID=3028688 RepID=UPI0029A2E5EC|nr:hypothetical protein [Streptomyces sp. MI02-2A]MDX3260823.1 hypothetical protein [Streptomyces sp. MI02-2A]
MRAWAVVKGLWQGADGAAEEVDPIRRKAASRLDRLPTADILDWADTVGSGLAKAIDDYRKQATPESLMEARRGAQSLLGVLDVLDRRQA